MARQSTLCAASRFIFLSLLAAPFTAAAVTSDFSFYPKQAQDCMYSAQKRTSCSPADTNQDLNKCLCGDDGGFVTNTAKCLRDDNIDGETIDTVFTTMTDACSQSQTPIKLSRGDWDDIVNDKDKETTTASSAKDEPTSTSSTNSETSSAEPTETEDAGKDGNKDETTDENKNDDDDDSSGGLPTGAIVGIAVGGAAVLAIAGVLVWWLRRRRQETPESDPMLAESGGFYNPHAYPPAEPMQNVSPGLAPAMYEQDHKTGRYSAVSGMSSPGISPAHTPSNATSPPPVSPQTHSWGPAGMGYAGAQQQQYSQNLHPAAYAVPPPAASATQAQYGGVPPHHGTPDAPVFEMDGSQVSPHRPTGPVVEMPGSEPAPYSSYRS